jgi:hypothetical protein
MKHLLQVEDTFEIKGRGLVVVPAIPLPSHFSNFRDTVTIVPTDSEPFQVEADFFLSHFNPGNYKLLLTFPSLSKSLLPVGSHIHVSESAHSKLVVADA